MLSLQVTTVATVIILPFGLLASWLLAKTEIRGKALLDAVFSLPLVVPPVATGYVLLWLLGRNGPIGGFLHDRLSWDIPFTWFAASLAAAVVSFPLMVKSMEVAMSAVDPRLERAARTLGAGPWRVFFTVTLPLSIRGVVGGVLLAFARGLGEFGATIVLAGNIPGKTQTVPLAIFTRLQVGDDAAAWRLVGYSVAVAFVALLLQRRLIKRTAV